MVSFPLVFWELMVLSMFLAAMQDLVLPMMGVNFSVDYLV